MLVTQSYFLQPPLSMRILQVRILEWVAMTSSRGSTRPRDKTHISCVSCIAGRFFTHWTTWEAVFMCNIYIYIYIYIYILHIKTASQVVQWVKNLPAMQETQEIWVLSLGRVDPLEEVMATHSSILTWRILMDRGGCKKYDWVTNTFTFTHKKSCLRLT